MFPIVFSTDHNFVMPTCVTIHSLLKTANPGVNYDIYLIVDSGVDTKDKKLLQQQVEKDNNESRINFIDIGDTFENGFEIRNISKACYNRLMIPWVIPNYDKIIYSDVDIIFKGDISELYNTDLKDALVAGVGGSVWNKGIIKKYLQKINADSEEYINSGFLLINSKLQREENLKERYLTLSRKKFLYQDQDIINLVCKGKIKKLPNSYNVKPIDCYNYEMNQIKVIHYMGQKPWDHFTFQWVDWWDYYNTSVVYDPQLNKNLSKKIMTYQYQIKSKSIVMKQKFKFLINYFMINKYKQN